MTIFILLLINICRIKTLTDVYYNSLKMIKFILQILIVALAGYGCGVLAIEMYNERLNLHGFNAIAALFGFIPFVFLCSILPMLLVGFVLQFLIWLFKS